MQDPDTSHLKGLGSKHTEYKTSGPDRAMLETFDNPTPQRDYTVKLESEEFTSLCPKTGQPDFASIRIEYIPNTKCVETKSLKLYLFAFRGEGAFMESITNRICNDLFVTLRPRWLSVTMAFNARGGIRLECAAVAEDLKGV